MLERIALTKSSRSQVIHMILPPSIENIYKECMEQRFIKQYNIVKQPPPPKKKTWTTTGSYFCCVFGTWIKPISIGYIYKKNAGVSNAMCRVPGGEHGLNLYITNASVEKKTRVNPSEFPPFEGFPPENW